MIHRDSDLEVSVWSEASTRRISVTNHRHEWITVREACEDQSHSLPIPTIAGRLGNQDVPTESGIPESGSLTDLQATCGCWKDKNSLTFRRLSADTETMLTR